MGWDSNSHLLLKAPISLGDISYATGSGGSSYDLGDMIKNGTTINMWAKYKPVKSGNPGVLTVTDRANTRYGMSGPSAFAASNGDAAVWTYNKPTAGQPNEWFRALDFDGYASNACQPLALGVGNFVYDAESQINVFIDAKSNSLRTDGKVWENNKSLSVYDLLRAPSDFTGHHIAFLISNGNTRNLVVTGTTFGYLINNLYGNHTFSLYGTDATPPSGTPTIPVMSGAYANTMFSIIICAMAGNFPTGGALYNVITSLGGITPYSVRFEGDCDRLSVPLRSGAYKLDSISITNLALSSIDMETEATYQGITWRAYRISASATFDTTGASWKPTTLAKTISGTISLRSGGSAMGFGVAPGDSAMTTSLSDFVSVAIYPSTSGQVRTVFTTESTQFLWVMKGGHTGSVNAYVNFTYPLDTPKRVPPDPDTTVSISITTP